MAKVPNKGAPQFMSRALRPGGGGDVTPPKSKSFDLGSIKGPPSPMNATKPTQIGKGIKMAPPFKPNSRRGR